MGIYIYLIGSSLLNLFLLWYVVKILRKFIFISETYSDLFLMTKADIFEHTLDLELEEELDQALEEEKTP